jgi:hypothetical protein
VDSADRLRPPVRLGSVPNWSHGDVGGRERSRGVRRTGRFPHLHVQNLGRWRTDEVGSNLSASATRTAAFGPAGRAPDMPLQRFAAVADVNSGDRWMVGQRSGAATCRARVLPNSQSRSRCAAVHRRGSGGRCARCVPAASTGDHGLAAKLQVSRPTCEVASGPSAGGGQRLPCRRRRHGEQQRGGREPGRQVGGHWQAAVGYDLAEHDHTAELQRPEQDEAAAERVHARPSPPERSLHAHVHDLQPTPGRQRGGAVRWCNGGSTGGVVCVCVCVCVCVEGPAQGLGIRRPARQRRPG